MTAVADAVFQTGLHIVIFGERGVGKTSLANVIEPLISVMEQDMAESTTASRIVVKVNVNRGDGFADVWNRAFGEISVPKKDPVIGINPSSFERQTSIKEAFEISNRPSLDEVRRTVSLLPGSVFIFDEFDRGSEKLRTDFTDLIKALSDYAIDSTIVVVGVSNTVDELVLDHASIVRAMVQIQLPRMNEKELGEILTKGADLLVMKFEASASRLIIRMSQGLPHYTHLIGLHSVRSAVELLRRVVSVTDVQESFRKAISQSEQTTQSTYLTATHSVHKDALYEKVILACAVASASAQDDLGFFHSSDVVRPIALILRRPNVPIGAFQRHIHEFCEGSRANVLERSGVKRAYKYRFHDPLLPSFIFMKAINSGLLTADQLASMIANH
jgi:hypothetical protein